MTATNSITPSPKRYNKNFVPKIDDSLTRRERAIRSAAFLDAEGVININHYKDKYTLRVQVVSTDRFVLEWLQNHYAGSIQQKASKEGERRLPCFDWTLMGAAAEEFLAEVFPFLMIKQEQARIGLKLRQFQGRHMARIPSCEKVSIWHPFYEQMKAVNKKHRYSD